MKKKPRRPTTSDANKQRLKVLNAVLAQVPFDGWTDAAYAQGLKQAGITPTETKRLFPNSLRDVIELFGAEADDAMHARIKAERGFERFRVRDKIAFAVRARLEYLTPQREAVRRLMLWYALPLHLSLGVRRLAKTADLMWRAAGDNSTDYNFYTKRILLGVVLKTTTLFWLDDEIPGCRASWDFLDRRISEVLKVGKSISLLKEFSPGEAVDFVRRKTGSSR